MHSPAAAPVHRPPRPDRQLSPWPGKSLRCRPQRLARRHRV